MSQPGQGVRLVFTPSSNEKAMPLPSEKGKNGIEVVLPASMLKVDMSQPDQGVHTVCQILLAVRSGNILDKIR